VAYPTRSALPFFSMLALFAVLLSACGSKVVPSGMMSSSPARTELRVGQPAPDFTLTDQNRQQVQLSSFRGKTVQLAFYVWAFSGG